LNFLDGFLKKYLNIKFHEDPSCGSQAAPDRWVKGQTDMRRPIVACHNVANMPKYNKEIKLRECDLCHSRSKGRPKQRCEDNIIQDIRQQKIKN